MTPSFFRICNPEGRPSVACLLSTSTTETSAYCGVPEIAMDSSGFELHAQDDVLEPPIATPQRLPAGLAVSLAVQESTRSGHRSDEVPRRLDLLSQALVPPRGQWPRLRDGHRDERPQIGEPATNKQVQFLSALVKRQKLPDARRLVRRSGHQAAWRIGSGNNRSGNSRTRRHSSSSPFRLAASNAAKASTPDGDQLIPWCLQRPDTAQSLNFSTRVLAIHNPARCRCS